MREWQFSIANHLLQGVIMDVHRDQYSLLKVLILVFMLPPPIRPGCIMFSGCPFVCACGTRWRHSPTGLPSTSRYETKHSYLQTMKACGRHSFAIYWYKKFRSLQSSAFILNFAGCCSSRVAGCCNVSQTLKVHLFSA